MADAETPEAVYRTDALIAEDIDADLEAKRELVLEVPRKRIVRPVAVGVACDDNLWPYVLWATALGAIFVLLYARTPLPLSGASRRLCFEALHDPAMRNFAAAMRVASDARVAELSPRQIDWLVWGLKNRRGDLDDGLAVARAPDLVEIDLRRGSLRIHGVDIPVNKTPLFYYAWYAHHRLRGDGWLTNPQSNKPDKSAGQELAHLMWSCAGHAKAAAGAEEIGLKAKTLDQNRSKIKQEIVALLGESLSAAYLFDERKDPRTGRMSYRLRVPPAEVRIRP
jgi:hypothetical protein